MVRYRTRGKRGKVVNSYFTIFGNSGSKVRGVGKGWNKEKPSDYVIT